MSTVVGELGFLLKKCCSFKHIHQIHGFMILRGLDGDNFLLGRLIDACFSLGFSNYGYSVFEGRSQADVYLFNTVIKGLSKESASEAVVVYNKIRLAGLRPDCYSFPFALRAVMRLEAVELGRQIHCQSLCSGLGWNIHVVTALIQMYSSCECVYDARKVFDQVSSKDVACWNAMVAGYVKIGQVENARLLFDQMPERNVISWTSIIAGLAQMNCPSEAIDMFRRMQMENVNPDEVALSAVLSACAHLGALELGEWIHNYIDKHGMDKTIPLSNALIDMYAKSGKVEKALQVFESMKHKSVITWTTMISGLALHGLGREALEIFFRMERAKVKPNEITFIAILSACSHVGLVELGRFYFNIMESRYGIQPKVEQYGCMIDLLSRAGYLQEAQELVRQMPFEANAAIWGSLLAASNTHHDSELGEIALKHLMKLEHWHSGNYSILSNIYAATGRWKESGMIRKMMRDKGVKKISGWSSIESKNGVQEFIAGDISHPLSDRIREVLCKMNEQLKVAEECAEILEADE
ncbi:hypothetical protein SLE2022_358620 [Rubroshorea leprosula]